MVAVLVRSAGCAQTSPDVKKTDVCGHSAAQIHSLFS